MTRIVIDTDPGQDDAVAILLALAEPQRIEVAGITTVAGNVPVELTTANALRLVELAGRPATPVYRGASQPLLRPLTTAEHVHGQDGLEGAGLPPPTRDADPGHAVSFLLDTLATAPPRSVTLCPLGPLTNIALAFAQAPELVERIERIVLMGGARDLGNITPAAEFNFYVDPHAAAAVMALDAPRVMFGLHATHQATASAARTAAIAGMDSPVGRAVTGMLRRPGPAGAALRGVEGHPVHDLCVIAWLLWPELFGGRDCHVAVETHGELTMGRSVIDWWGRTDAPPNTHVIDSVDADTLFERLAISLEKL
jgi:purine nucleosidase